MTSSHAIASSGNAAADVASVRRVLLAESDALRIMADQLSDDVARASTC